MSLEVKSFEVYGFKIEVHSGGRRVWPPSFKHFINDKMDSGELSVGEVMKTCNVSQSLVYKWRGDVRHAKLKKKVRQEESIFSEIVVEENRHPLESANQDFIIIKRRDVEMTLPVSYPVDHLMRILHSMEAN